MPVDVERHKRLVDLLCKMHDRWVRRYVEAIHTPCHNCGVRPVDKESS